MKWDCFKIIRCVRTVMDGKVPLANGVAVLVTLSTTLQKQGHSYWVRWSYWGTEISYKLFSVWEWQQVVQFHMQVIWLCQLAELPRMINNNTKVGRTLVWRSYPTSDLWYTVHGAIVTHDVRLLKSCPACVSDSGWSHSQMMPLCQSVELLHIIDNAI